mmetsp:Transcript_27433/g.58956  ORF Transcript_27433/g.58956 Transcript_27433/m.58956 type:complete len:560 (+) Transcript_27433:50-1729(+)
MAMASECHPTTHPSSSTCGNNDDSSQVSFSIREYFLQTLTTTPFVQHSVTKINTLLRYSGVPEKSLLTNEEFVLSSTAVVATLVGYYVLFGKRHRRKRKVLAEELKAAQRQVHHLEEELLAAKREDIIASTPTRPKRKSREIRIFMDGAFDVMHYGHMNAFRLGRSLGTYLIVGVNSDESIKKCKGPPLMEDNERLTMVKGCKFVDEVVPNCPYIMTSEYLDYIFATYDVDYVVHGDDPCIVDGKDVYESAKRRGRYRSIPRTEGVSTTDIVGRMLMMTKEHHMRTNRGRKRGNSVGSLSVSNGGLLEGVNGDNTHRGEEDDSDNEIHNEGEENDDVSVLTAANYNDNGEDNDVGVLGHQSKFLTTSMMLRLFSAGVKHPEEGMRVVYVDGAWDMFHCGHVDFLEEASKRGDYLIVGIHGDSVVNKRRGGNLPLMNLHERVLSVLGCKYMNDVLIDAPMEVTPDMIASLRITEVVHGTESDDSSNDFSFDDRYRFPKEMGIFTTIQSPSKFKLQNIVSRMQKKQVEFQRKIDRKKAAEREWFDNKYQNGSNKNNNGTGK